MAEATLSPNEIISRLKEQNAKLQAEHTAISAAIKEALVKKSPPKPNVQRKADLEADPKQKEINDTIKKIQKIKRENTALRLQLGAQAEEELTVMENELKFLKGKYKEIWADQQSLKNIKETQDDAINRMAGGKDYMTKIEALKEEIKTGNENYSKFRTNMRNDLIKWKENHQRMTGIEKSIRSFAKIKRNPEPDRLNLELNTIQKKYQITQRALKVIEKKRKRAFSTGEVKKQQIQTELQPIQEKLKQVNIDCQEKERRITEMKRSIRLLQQRKSQNGPLMDFTSTSEADNYVTTETPVYITEASASLTQDATVGEDSQKSIANPKPAMKIR